MVRSTLTRLLAALMVLAAPLLATTPASANPAANLKAAETFLAANAKKKGIVTTASGLQYQVMRAGTGPRPTARNVVRVHYRGYFVSGRIFDQSYGGTPASFPVGAVIPGWTEALQLMQVGSRYRLWIHPRIGYGAQGSPPVIPPNSLLVFDVELLGIER